MIATLPTRRLGGAELRLTPVGFGAWAVGGGGWAFGWGPQDDAQSIASIRHALELGVNWIDTAAVYGLGHSEEVLRQALEGIPSNDRPYIFTKCSVNVRPHCIAWALSGSICFSFTGPTRAELRLKTRGRQ